MTDTTKTFAVEAHVGTVFVTVEAESAEEAMVYAVDRWTENAAAIFTGATFETREVATA